RGGAIRGETFRMTADERGQEVGIRRAEKSARATQLSWPVHRLSFLGEEGPPSVPARGATRLLGQVVYMHPGRTRVRAGQRCPTTCQVVNRPLSRGHLLSRPTMM